jgi:two-component system, chemotaxis family, sensor kinase CheA
MGNAATMHNETIKQIYLEIDDLKLNDSVAWMAIFNELTTIATWTEDICPALFHLISLCKEGARAVSERSRDNLLQVVGEISNVLTVAGQVLENNPEGKKKSEKVALALAAALGCEINPELFHVDEAFSFEKMDINAADTATKDDGDAVKEIVDYMPEDIDVELFGEFITEAMELITSAEEALLALENDPGDEESVGMIFRAFHTVKGTAAFMDLTLIAEMGHHAESLLSRVRDKEIMYGGGYADLTLQALDMIKDMIGLVEAAIGGVPLLKPEGYDDLMIILKDPEASGVSGDQQDAPAPRIGDILVAQGSVDRADVEKAVAEDGGDPVGVRLVKNQAATVADVGKALRTQRRMKGQKSTVETSIRVTTDRLDRLIDMVGELVIAHSMVAQDTIEYNSGNHDLLKKVSHTSKIVRQLQDMTMSMRMVPLKATFNKMARLVRDLSRKIGKNVTFVTEGEDTEIDRNLVDIISDPLVHMVRNAVDHGIELPDERVQNGKPPEGEVRLSAYHSAGSVVVEIVDNGKGLDREAILAKARQRNLVDDNVSLSNREIFNLVFEPGFSTAAEVTDVSGRGVGMDVVRKNIESLRGQVEISSELGKGSVFKMSLPLTLAIIDGMIVRVGKERYIIPTVSIVRSVKPTGQELTSVLQKGEMLSFQDGLIPLFGLAEIYQHGDNQVEESLVVVVEDEGKQSGLVIDELIGRQQVVIKTLGETMSNIPGISGGAIMPNGRVGLILDVANFVKFASSDQMKAAVKKSYSAAQSLAHG